MKPLEYQRGPVHRGRTYDRSRLPPGLVRARKLEARYGSELRKIARQVGLLIQAWAPTDGTFDLSRVPGLLDQLARYSEVIRPWATSTASRIIQEIAIKERRSWAAHARQMSRGLHEELLNAPTGAVTRQLLHGQVDLITSLPREAGERVHRLTLAGMEDSARASEIARQIMRSGEVTEARATLIARTEVGRTATSLTEARSRFVGSTSYVWRTARDSDVRSSHARMEGRVVEWGKPPTLDKMTGHAGCLPNCRCYPEPILPDWS